MNNIYALWFGGTKPDYVEWTINNYKIVNNNWNIKLIEYSTEQLINYKDQNDKILKDSIKECFRRFDVNFGYDKVVSVYKRRMLLNEYDVYVDLDTFPISNMDNFILPHKTERNKEFEIRNISYCRDQKRKDTWILSNTNRTYCAITNIYKNINLNSEIIYHTFTFMNPNNVEEFERRRDLFFKCKLDLEDNFCCRKFTPCEHYMGNHRKTTSKYSIPEKKLFDKVLL